MFTLLISALNRRALWATMVSLAAGLVPLGAYWLIGEEASPLTNLLRFTYSQTISVRTLFSTNCTVALFGVQVRTVYLSLPVLAAGAAVFSVLAYQAFRRHSVCNS